MASTTAAHLGGHLRAAARQPVLTIWRRRSTEGPLSRPKTSTSWGRFAYMFVQNFGGKRIPGATALRCKVDMLTSGYRVEALRFARQQISNSFATQPLAFGRNQILLGTVLAKLRSSKASADRLHAPSSLRWVFKAPVTLADCTLEPRRSRRPPGSIFGVAPQTMFF